MRSMERSFADLEYESKKRKTGRERFLERMGGADSLGAPVGADQAVRPKSWKGESALCVGSILPVHCVQLLYNLSDPAIPFPSSLVTWVKACPWVPLAGLTPSTTQQSLNLLGIMAWPA